MAKYLSKFKMIDEVGKTVIAEIRDSDAQARLNKDESNINNIKNDINNVKDDINNVKDDIDILQNVVQTVYYDLADYKHKAVNWNLLTNSSFTQNLNGWTQDYYDGTISSKFTTYKGRDCLQIKGGALGCLLGYTQVINDANWLYGNDFTLSYDIAKDNLVKGKTNYQVNLYIVLKGKNAKGEDVKYSESAQPTLSDDFTKITSPIAYSRYRHTLASIDSFQVKLVTRDFTGDVYFRNGKLEIGSVDTEWMSSQNDITSLQNKLTYDKSSENIKLY